MVKSADRAIRILETVGLRREGMTHGELSAQLHIPKSSLTSLLGSLTTRGYVSFDGINKRFSLGPQILIMAGHYLSGLDIVRTGQPIVRKLMLETQESVELAVMKGKEAVIVCKEDCSRPLQRVIEIGGHAPMYATAAGKAILAHLPESEIAAYLASTELVPLTRKTITDPEKLRKELNKIRRGHPAYSHQELNEGIIAMAAPVFDFSGHVTASVVVPVPTVRFNQKTKKRIEGSLKKTSVEISRCLGFVNPRRSAAAEGG